jgi:hypothetical protein
MQLLLSMCKEVEPWVSTRSWHQGLGIEMDEKALTLTT